MQEKPDSTDETELATPKHNSEKRKRPIGVVLLAILNLLNGVYIGYDHGHRLQQTYSTSHEVVIMSDDYVIDLVEQTLIIAVALASSIGLIIGAKFGWILATFHWIWRTSRDTLIPLAAASLGQPFPPLQRPTDWLAVCFRLAFCGMLLYYLCRPKVLDWFSIGEWRKIHVLITMLIAAVFLEACFITRELTLAPSEQEMQELLNGRAASVLFHVPPDGSP